MVNEELEQNYYGYTLSFQDFDEIRHSPDAKEMLAKYNEFRKNHPDFGLKELKGKGEIEAELEGWESSNPDRCKEIKSEQKFFGSKEGGGGKLDKYLEFLFVPAVKDPATEADEEGKGWFSQLVNILIRSRLIENSDIRTLNEDVKKQYIDKLDTQEICDLQGSLNKGLTGYAPNTSAKLSWNTDDFDPLYTLSLKIRLTEGEYETDLLQAGHGTQRAFLMTLSQYLGEQNTKNGKTLILGIEEPELYQHPTRLRHIVQKLYTSPSNASQNSKLQLILVTHSPYFITVESLNTIRRFYKREREIRVAEMNLKSVADELCLAHNDQSYIAVDALKAKLRTIMNPWISEGFFASCVVLVEGKEDMAYLKCYAETKNQSLEAHDTAVIPCSGKTNLDKFLLIFRRLEIPTYVIWDNDQNNKNEQQDQQNKQQDKRNDMLLRLNGAKEGDYKTRIEEMYACFENNFADEVKKQVDKQNRTTMTQSYKNTGKNSKSKETPKRIQN